MSDESTRPRLLIVAGPNGSGKTTVTEQGLAHTWFQGCEYINPVLIARDEFGDWNSPEAVLKAAREAQRRREACLTDHRSVAFETVFSAPDKVDYLHCPAISARVSHRTRPRLVVHGGEVGYARHLPGQRRGGRTRDGGIRRDRAIRAVHGARSGDLSQRKIVVHVCDEPGRARSATTASTAAARASLTTRRERRAQRPRGSRRPLRTRR